MATKQRKTNHQQLLAHETTGKLLLRLSLPAMVGMLVQAFYNIIDTVFIGHAVGPLGIAGLSIVFPAQILIFAIMSLIGIGCAALVSMALGAKDQKKAELVFGNAIVLSIIVGLIIAIVGITQSEFWLRLFGGDHAIMPFAKPFLQIISIGVPFISFSATANNVVRAEGNAKTAMLVMIISAAINTVLDPIFIFGLHMGVAGAATGTVIAQIFTTFYLLYYFLTNKSALRIRRCCFKLKASICRQMVAIGFPSFVRTGVGSLTIIIVNNVVIFYGGAVWIAAYGIINRIMQFSYMPIFGVAQGMQPILGFNYGAKQFDRARSTVIKALTAATIIACIPFIVIYGAPRLLMMIFTNDQALIQHATHAINYVAIFLPLLGLQVIGSSFFQSIGKAKPALLLSLARRALVFLPLLAIMPHLFHLNGVWVSFAIADLVSALITMSLFIPQLKKLKICHKKQQDVTQNAIPESLPS